MGLNLKRPNWSAAGLGLAALLVFSGGSALAGDKPPSAVRDLHYGEVLFSYFNGDHFDAIVRLLAAAERGRMPYHGEEAELLLGGLYLAYGQHDEAAARFESLLARDPNPEMHDAAWLHLAKLKYTRGAYDDAVSAIDRIGNNLDRDAAAEKTVLLANARLALGQAAESARVLDRWSGAPDWTAYTRFNLGVALLRSGDTAAGRRELDKLGTTRFRRRARRAFRQDSELGTEEARALIDKANVSLGFSYLAGDEPVEARKALDRVRLEGPFSNEALLAAGWADAASGEFRRALVPWRELNARDPLDPAVQESKLAIPYALASLDAHGQAADAYSNAIAGIEDELVRLADARRHVSSGGFADELLAADAADTMGWFWQLEELPGEAATHYLHRLIASHGLQEQLKDIRDLRFLAANLARWRESLGAFDDTVAVRRQRLDIVRPQARRFLDAGSARPLQQRKEDLLTALNRARESTDGLALATAAERDQFDMLREIDERLARLPAGPQRAELERKQKLLQGALLWRLNAARPVRLRSADVAWRNLETLLVAQRRHTGALTGALAGAPQQTAGFSDRIASQRARIDRLSRRVALAQAAANDALATTVVAELDRERVRLEGYLAQARYALAASYDRAAMAREGR